MTKAIRPLNSKNHASWSLRGCLKARFVGQQFGEHMVSPDDPVARARWLPPRPKA